MIDIFIYGLLDPDTGKCRYVGKANNVEKRYYNHLRESKKTNSYKHNWIQQLLTQDKKPQLKILEVCNELNWVEKEKWWIRYFKKNKQPLTNLTEGGDGCVLFKRHPISEETKQKISQTLMGHPVSEESRKKMSDRMNKYLETNPPIQLGRKHSEESRKKMSLSLLGRKLSPEHKSNIKLAVQRRGDTRKDITFEKILEQCSVYNFKQIKICEYFKCDRHILTYRIQKYGYRNWLDFRNKLNPESNFKVDKRPFPKSLSFEQILEQSQKCDFKLTKVSDYFDCDRHFVVKIVRKNGYKDWKDFKKKISVEQAYLQKVG